MERLKETSHTLKLDGATIAYRALAGKVVIQRFAWHLFGELAVEGILDAYAGLSAPPPSPGPPNLPVAATRGGRSVAALLLEDRD